MGRSLSHFAIQGWVGATDHLPDAPIHPSLEWNLVGTEAIVEVGRR